MRSRTARLNLPSAFGATLPSGSACGCASPSACSCGCSGRGAFRRHRAFAASITARLDLPVAIGVALCPAATGGFASGVRFVTSGVDAPAGVVAFCRGVAGSALTAGAVGRLRFISFTKSGQITMPNGCRQFKASMLG